MNESAFVKVAVFGLGEAGSLIATDLALSHQQAANNAPAALELPPLTVTGFDPADVPTPAGVERFSDPQKAVEGADFILALTAAADATTALEQALEAIPPKSVYVDFASAAASLKRQLAETAASRQIAFCDVALMAIMPGNGIRAPALFSGDGAKVFASLMEPRGMPVTLVSDQPGDAAQHKLLRSVAMKGLAAVLIEALEGAQAAGCAPWLWQNLCDEITAADATVLERLVKGTDTHARRRLHEMQASLEQLHDLDIAPTMTPATVANLEKVLQMGIPEIPE